MAFRREFPEIKNVFFVEINRVFYKGCFYKILPRHDFVFPVH